MDPTNPNNSPASTANVISRSATTSPYLLETPSISNRRCATLATPLVRVSNILPAGKRTDIRNGP
ncbi:hypothetical protein Acsp05_54280 [Actinokineospora sp. NBRC 105648]|nr:hypothetical protein Acsp05_54280 [Actinokineospora sp. NBRC 105648]